MHRVVRGCLHIGRASRRQGGTSSLFYIENFNDARRRIEALHLRLLAGLACHSEVSLSACLIRAYHRLLAQYTQTMAMTVARVVASGM